jgi:hypothetical protein
MHALKIEDETRLAVATVKGVRIGTFLEGLFRSCRERYDSATCDDMVDDTHQLLSEAGYGPLEQIGYQHLAQVIFTSTRDWEYVGDNGTIDLVREQRDYTRLVVGEVLFDGFYRGLETRDGRSYYAPIQ